MDRQLIISVGREFGSGGHAIAEALAERFHLALYDSNLLEHIAQEKNIDHGELKKFDEKPKNKLLSRTVRGYSSSAQENLANMQFEYLRKKAADGESFVVVGRCAETKLKDFPGLISFFILGDREKKAERVMQVYGVSKEEAIHMMEREDWERKTYHNYYCKGKWGDSRNYDFSINSSRLGIEGTIDILEGYVKTLANVCIHAKIKEKV